MKKLILAAFALTTAVSVFAQGSVILNNRISGAPFNQTTHIWGPGTNPGLSLIGLGSNDSPAGTTAFSQSGMALIGAGGSGGKYGYATTFASLIGAVGAGAAESSLQPFPGGGVTTFRSGTSLGDVASITMTLPAAFADATFATFEIVAWDNSSSQYATWSLASVAWLRGDIAAGHTSPFNVGAIGGTGNITPDLTQQGTVLTSFNLYFIPEPSTFALAGLGAAALLIFRRRK
jgi:hypothetical protein